MATQKEIKKLKKEITLNSAISVGFWSEIILKIPYYALIHAEKEIKLNRLIKKNTNKTEIENMLVSESVKVLNYQEFKKIVPYFFGY